MSNYIEIDKKPVIFDDPEHCGYKFGCRERCPNIYGKLCSVFKVDLSTEQNCIAEKIKLIKCPECKKAWQAAKERQSKPCPECKNLRGIDEDGAFVCDCKHCGDEVPF